MLCQRRDRQGRVYSEIGGDEASIRYVQPGVIEDAPLPVADALLGRIRHPRTTEDVCRR